MSEHRFLERLRATDPVGRTGRVRKILPTFIEADGPSLPLGALCTVELGRSLGSPGAPSALAQVVSVRPDAVVLAPLTGGLQTFMGARVAACSEPDRAPVGERFVGRAVDALGRPIDGGPDIPADRFDLLDPGATPPLSRQSPTIALETGVRAIDGLLTLGLGQRVGVFAASGVGKTSLVLELTRDVEADVCVVCLIGERGREVESFWSKGLPSAAKARTCLIAATSDQPAAMRVRAANYALTLAEHWRANGKHVLLLLDSITRLAMAMREIGLAAGEPPTLRAYTPAVFAQLPKLVERCGALRSGGAITAVMTILSESDEIDDPISELMKSLLDGHIMLSRGLAEQGHYPAIDAPRSLSRFASLVRSKSHRRDAEEAIRQLSAYDASKTLIEAGLYVAGSNPQIDLALERRPHLNAFLCQSAEERTSFAETRQRLAEAVGGAHV